MSGSDESDRRLCESREITDREQHGWSGRDVAGFALSEVEQRERIGIVTVHENLRAECIRSAECLLCGRFRLRALRHVSEVE